MNDDQFRRLLDDFGYSWQGYRKVRKRVMQRLVRHMQRLDVRDVEDYREKIKSDAEIREKTQQLMTVSISRFFRDRTLWKCIKEKLIPEILSGNPTRVNVWSAGCALGQEVYSFNMLWLLLEEELMDPLPPLFIVATDINQENLDKAACGVYDDHIVKTILGNCLKRFFHYDEGRYLIADDLKQNITWQLNDLTNVMPMKDYFHIIFLRNNLLTYYKQEFYKEPVDRIIDALTRGGYLIIGAREKIFVDEQKLSRVHNIHGIFQKK
ncbi:MAG: CheR family methyltransferase [Smithella sp.]